MRSRIGSVTGARRRPGSLVAALAVLLAGGSLALAPAPASSAVVTTRFTAVADAFVDKAQPNANFGTRTVLRSDDAPVQRSYLRFNVSGLAGPATRATLRLYTKAATTGGSAVSPVAVNTWGEKAITWATAPAPGAAVATSGSAGSGVWVSVDVTSLIPGNGTFSLALTSPGGAAAFASRETGANGPRLVVETGSTTTTQPPATTTTTTAPSGGGGSGGAGCNASINARQAKYNLLGYLFGDGHFGSSGYNYTARTTCKVTRVKAAIKALGINVSITNGNQFHFPKVAPFDKPQDFGPSPETAAGVATADDLRYFLAGIIEGEGSGSGKVLDDPNWGRTAGLVELYKRMSVVVKPDHAPPACGCPTATGFWNTFVDPSASTSVYNGYIAIIRSWPFAEMTRVPKPR